MASSSFSSLALGPVCFKAGHVIPASWVSGVRALPLCAQGLGLILLPGVVNCSACRRCCHRCV